MKIVGMSVREIRFATGHGAFRVLYLATDVIFILHAFQRRKLGRRQNGSWIWRRYELALLR